MLIAKQISFLFTSLLIAASSFAQTKIIDSLKEILPLTKDTQQVNILNSLADLFYKQADNRYNSNLTISGEFANKALQLAQQIHDTKGTGIALYNTGNVLSFKEQLHDAISTFKQSVPFLKETGENKTLGLCLKILAECIHQLGNNEQAIQYYDSAFAVFQKINDTSGLILSLEWKGHSYFDMGDYKNGYQYGQQASELAQKAKDTLAQIQTADHLANLFLGAGMPETVLGYMRVITHFYPNTYIKKEISSWEVFWGLLKAGEAYLQLSDTDSAMLVAEVVGFDRHGDTDHDIFLGHLYTARHEYNKALPYFTEGLQLSEQSGHTISVARHANGLSQVYLALGNYAAALRYANKAVQAAQSIHASLELKNGIGTLTDIYDKTHNYSKAYHYSQLYKTISDSLATEQYKRKLALIEIQHELDNQKQHARLLVKENQLQLQQNAFEKENTKKVMLTSIIIISALIILAIAVIRNIGLKRKKDALQKKQLQQELELQAAESKRIEADFKVRSLELESQALRAQMNPHFIFNCLNSINRFIISNDAAKAADYLTKFAKLIRIVLEQSGKSFVPLEDELKCLQLYMDLEALRFEIPFQYEINCNGTDASSVMIPTLLLQPFVENAIWHGLQGNGSNGKINIDMHLEDKILHCKICDNGVGRAATTIKDKNETEKKSMGINITKHRLELIDSKDDYNSGIEIYDVMNNEGEVNGTCVDIKIPVK